MTAQKIRILVVEDSPTAREFLVHTFNSTPDMTVVGTAADGDLAIEAVKDLQPDVVSMDVSMPRVSGLEATRRIMRENPVPIVIVSGIFQDDVSATFQALDAGALAFVRKPPAPSDATYQESVASMIQTVRLMSEVKVVRRRAMAEKLYAVTGLKAAAAKGKPRVVAIGASTGGPPAIRDLLSAFTYSDDVPVLIVQHIAEGFVEGFTTWLASATGRCIHLARQGEVLTPGHIYIAPDGRHMGVDAQERIVLLDTPLENGLRPSVACMFRTLRQVFGGEVAAVLLSGMGKDGARDLLDLKIAGAQTYAQSQDSAMVFGMPGEAIRLNAAGHIMTPAQIGDALNALLRINKLKA